MYEDELHDREIYKYPPYFRIIKITLKQKDYQKLKEGTIWLHQVLVNNLSVPILGPEEPAISRIRNEYIRTIMIKIPANSSLLNTKIIIQKILKSFEAVAQYKTIKTAINVDYY